MYGNSLLTDKDITFFGDQSYSAKDSISKEKDCTKNSSNPEKDYKELMNEVTNIRDINLNTSNSRNHEITPNVSTLIDGKIWGKNNETQDSNQFHKNYRSYKNKDKPTPKNKVKNTQFIPNNNIDYSLGTEELSNIQEEDDERTNSIINRISSIKIKTNNIDQLDKKSKLNLNSPMNTMNRINTPLNNRIQHYSVTEPDDFYNHHREHFSGSFQNNMLNNNQNGFNQSNVTPQRVVTRGDNRSMTFLYNNGIHNPMNFTNSNNYESHGSGNNNLNNPNNVPNFPRLINRGSIISNKSTNYSSHQKKKENDYVNYEEEGDAEGSVEYIEGNSVNEENYINFNFANEGQRCNTMNNYHQSMSDKKVRLPTTESVESNNSAQYNYFRNHPQNLVGINLNHQFSSNGNMQYFFDDESRKQFSSSFNGNMNNNNYIMQQGMYNEPAFTPNLTNNFNSNNFNNNMAQQNNNQLNFNNLNSQNLINANKQKINKHTKSDHIFKNKMLGSEQKKILNLEEIALGKDKRTTVMIRNIPIKYSDDMLLKELEEFKGKFDCLYLPFDFAKHGNRGYAFINFIHPLHILLFYEKFEGKTWNFFESKKICELNSANYQGISEIKRHAKNYKSENKPSFFIILDSMINLEIPKKFVNQIKFFNPNAVFEDGNYGGIKVKSFGK